MTVYIVWNRIYERVVGVYSSEDLAEKVCTQLNDPDARDYEWDQFDLDAEPRG